MSPNRSHIFSSHNFLNTFRNSCKLSGIACVPIFVHPSCPMHSHVGIVSLLGPLAVYLSSFYRLSSSLLLPLPAIPTSNRFIGFLSASRARPMDGPRVPFFFRLCLTLPLQYMLVKTPNHTRISSYINHPLLT